MMEWARMLYGLCLLLVCWATGTLRKLRRSEEGWRYHGRKKK